MVLNATLISILCGETWWWDSDNESHIIFYQNGTGLLVARRELCLFIVAEFKWVVVTQKTQELLSQPFINNSSSSTQILEQFKVEICLTKNRPPKLGRVDTEDYLINEALLTDEAFTPRSHLLTLEKGSFLTVDDAKLKGRRLKQRGISPTYLYRLRFDPSPYPSREQWKDPGGAPDALRFWEWREFCAGQLPNQTPPQGKMPLHLIRNISKKIWR